MAELAYYVVTRRIEFNMQVIDEVEKCLILSSDKIKTENAAFYLESVYDISVKKTNNLYQILYLHTNKGVFSFIVKEDPADFIRQVKGKLRK
ncbi:MULTISPECIES: hypothetical protein [Bacillaceae]|uniref:hypothetical protein n=1 Tax=Bacillaceae TaxID=186817 RepID=UPI00177B4496|nr:MULTISPECIES: hypothetical protein [Bacillaceae]MBE0317734.1 hypothetical protein [Xanthomonas citri pv. punicae]MCE4050041.1 hypothetical protein [Bacillus sp. Au-Bac7]MCM3031452.1 hypothetical protein [Niallia sp. MER 6]MDL0435594.1 hypothetical protein [Niallia sp. SS-2023]UPO88099.1 hypothetical protein L8T27_002560 [Niallia sp. Man26]